MDSLPERRLNPRWVPELIALSYLISWLGAYTSTQIMIHAKYTRSAVLKWVWTFLASIAFGFCAIWSMHFVGMLACRLDVNVRFNIPLTILSAMVAVLFTFAALASPYAMEAIENSTSMRTLSKWNQGFFASVSHLVTGRSSHDLEAGYTPLQTAAPEDHGDDSTTTSMLDDEDIENRSSDDEAERTTTRPPAAEELHRSTTPRAALSRLTSIHRRFSLSSARDRRSPTNSPVRPANHPLQRALSSSGVPLRTHASQESTPRSSSTETTSSSESSFTRNLSGLSRETRARIKAQAKERPVPEFGWRYWLQVHYRSITVSLCIRAAVWAAAIVFMHYCGCIAMVHMESHFGRQMIFSTIAAIGCCSMHYTGMAAATFYTRSPPSSNPGYPEFLPITIIGIAVSVCVASNAMLAHAAISSRNRMAEIILTKRRLWRIMAEKEAAEQAIDLKQQFISIASHEIRTPLHTVNGYCELLARTPLTEEQALYVTSIQQACHAINVIAGNVLDFSKLDRNNVELNARPVRTDVRKMLVDLAKITEARGIQPGQPGVDVIVSIGREVPQIVFLDETYAYRILMNLLSNAQKFCDQGYICLAVSMREPGQLVFQVIDTGCGIPESFRGALFEPFRQADTSLTRPRQGTGLGLSIVKHLVQRMSGTIDVDSQEGRGTTFTVKIPVTLPSESPSPTTARAPAIAATKRIRVIYRNSRTQEQFVRLWSQYGYTAFPGSPTSTPAEIVKGVNVVWTDTETVAHSPALRSLLASSEASDVVIFVVHSDAQELAVLDPELRDGLNVVLVKRPVIMHTVAEWVDDPEPHVGRHIKPTKVRFALPDEKGALGVQDGDRPAAIREGSGIAGGEIPRSPLIQANGGAADTQEMPPSVREKVLLVEDNMVNQRLGCRLLEKLGYEVATANDGQQAIEMIRNTYFSCCLMDCQMPVLDGFQATRRIREMEASGQLPGHLPVIALTANVTQESESECKEAGMDHFLPKPLKMADLEATLKRLRRTTSGVSSSAPP
ncbi:hypothetical protein BN946_scf184499.g23 [Trametes cinnabarina]|uniref:Histidine kinase n=1 Tax=Pycnoporus cinnabarinus TaxID=5643 RepID=A0A060S7X7_PYCCI|nr:hypothetical protein BN946_scf184499.g23 [Trametes cinnabarina]